MASINGISVRSKKSIRKDGTVFYSGGLYAKGSAGQEKIGEATQLPDSNFVLRTEPGFSAEKIENAIAGFGGGVFEDNIYRLFTLSEYEHWFRIAKREGYDGLGIMECAHGYVGRYLTKEENVLFTEQIAGLMEEEKAELEARFPGENAECVVFSYPVDFVLGEPVGIDDLRDTDKKKGKKKAC